MEARFASDNYEVLRGVVDRDSLDLYTRYALSYRDLPGYYDRNAFSKALGRYADAFGESLLLHLQPAIEACTGLLLLPCYSYLRIYEVGTQLPRHTDRPSCEISATLTVGYQADALWPIWVEAHGEDRAVPLEAGDLMVYKGAEVPHWREEPDLDYWVQLFLHYVDAEGDYTEYAYDRRDAIGPVDLGAMKVEKALARGPVGRNQPCPCGSGERFKRCHGANG